MSDSRENRISYMKRLAMRITGKKKKEKDVIAVLLFGSVAAKNIHLDSDLDIVVIRDSESNLMKRHQSLMEDVRVDLWDHSRSFYVNLLGRDWQPKEMFWYSLFLNILQGCEVLYDRESEFRNHRESAMHWIWPEDCRDFIQDKLRRALSDYEKGDCDKFENLVFLRKLYLLHICRRLLDMGKPVSVRNKDYYLKCKKHFSAIDFESIFGRNPSLVELKSLIETAMDLFYREVKNREPWTELKDAKYHLSNGEGFMAAISLQNGAYYIGGAGLSNRNIRRENRDFLYPESELELIEKSKDQWNEFHSFYRKVHNVDAWSDEDIDSMCSQLLARIGE